MSLTALQNNIGYQFHDTNLLQTAVTHSSFFRGQGPATGKHNERLEFLGDAFLDAVVGEALYLKLPQGEEGRLSKLRALVVCENSLAKVARKLDVGSFLLLGHGEELNGGRARESILADAMEAIIGAVYLDGGFPQVRDLILSTFDDVIQNAMEGKLHFDFKSEFQEMIQLRRAGDNIRYESAGEEGPDHNKTFHVRLFVNSCVVGKGSGKSKKEAEQQAAKSAIEKKQGEKQ